MQTRKHRTGSLFQRGNVYWLKYMVDGRLIRQSLGTSNRKEAERKQKEIMRPLAVASRSEVLAMNAALLADARSEQAAVELEANPPLTWGDAWARYEAAKNRPDSSDRTLVGYDTIYRRFRCWIEAAHPAKKALRDVDAATAGEYAQQMIADGLSASTFNQHIGFLRLLWRVLEKPIRSDGNPWQEIQKRRLQKLAHRRRAVTGEQLERILEATAEDPDLHDLLIALANTGQRLVDGVMLRWDSIDFTRRVITLYPRKTAQTGKPIHAPLFPAMADMLRNRHRDPEAELVFPDLAADYTRDPSSIVKRVQKAFESAGLDTRTNKPGVKRAVSVYGAHSLRHYYATAALAAGIPAEIVKRITGHTSDAMLEGYEHVDAAMIGALADRLSNGKANTPTAALPPAGGDPGAVLERVRELAEGINSRTWKTARAELLALAGKA